ncbi:MAG TPA: Maf family protein, partial [Cellvibrionaceae bacterium]|nr:Maf family protein [Cellvibrionaceae bacterium]
PRRADLLRQIGVRFAVHTADVPELYSEGERPEDYVARLSLAKARAVAPLVSLPVLGADTVAVCDGEVLEKPRDAEHAQAMLLSLAGRRHQVMTGVALVDQARIQQQVVITQVLFGPITPAQAAAYWQSGEPADKAGGYAIQGLGAVFVERIEGSFSNVVGLPLYETAQLLRAVAVPCGLVG